MTLPLPKPEPAGLVVVDAVGVVVHADGIVCDDRCPRHGTAVAR